MAPAARNAGKPSGAGLVIDHSKHLNRVVAFDASAQTVTVEPGIVLDELNGWLRKHGLWFPVDVSTSAQATLGGMAGNNSCGSRSLYYGNMVHNVAALDVRLADGTEARFGPERDMNDAPPRVRELVAALRSIGEREHDEIARVVPRVMRRVGGYNADVFNPQSERPYTADGSVNLAHLLVGSEGTLAWTRTLTLSLAPLPRHRALGVVNFGSLHAAMAATSELVTLGPSAVELVDRTMIDLARSNPSFRPVIERALVGEPDAILLVEFTGDDAPATLRRLDDLEDVLANHGLERHLVKVPLAAEQKSLWDVRKAGLNIMMSLRGDGKPVSFIEDCAVPLAHLAEYVDRLTEIFRRHGTRGTWYAHASVGTLHVRPILDMRRDGAQKMRAIAEEASAIVREYKGAYSGEHGDGLVRSEWVAWQFGPRLTRAFEAIKDLFDPAGVMNPGKIVRPSRMDDASLFRFPPAHRTLALDTGLDWTAWDVQNDPRTGALSPPGSGGDPAHGFAKAVEMCNNNGHCRKFDAGTMCPSYRVTRDEIHLTRGRANTLRHALSGALGAPRRVGRRARRARSLRRLQRLSPRMPDRCRHGADEDRVPASMAARARRALARPAARLSATLGVARRARRAAAEPAQPVAGARARYGAADGHSAARSLPQWRRDTVRRASRALRRMRTPMSCCFVDTFTRYFEPENAVRGAAGAAGSRLFRRPSPRRGSRCVAAAVLRPHVPRRRPGRRGAGAKRGG